jgi:hypothetical protein
MTSPTGESYRAAIDGTDVPFDGEPRFNRVFVKRIDANTIEETNKFNDKPLVISRMTPSVDGKSMNITANVSRSTSNRAIQRDKTVVIPLVPRSAKRESCHSGAGLHSGLLVCRLRVG